MSFKLWLKYVCVGLEVVYARIGENGIAPARDVTLLLFFVVYAKAVDISFLHKN